MGERAGQTTAAPAVEPVGSLQTTRSVATGAVVALAVIVGGFLALVGVVVVLRATSAEDPMAIPEIPGLVVVESVERFEPGTSAQPGGTRSGVHLVRLDPASPEPATPTEEAQHVRAAVEAWLGDELFRTPPEWSTFLGTLGTGDEYGAVSVGRLDAFIGSFLYSAPDIDGLLDRTGGVVDGYWILETSGTLATEGP
jgi:hypothetical protein